MPTRARQSQAEDGFILIEVLVSALILAIVAGAVLTLIAATTRGAAAQRDRSVAYDLAQADQARLRTLNLTEISGTERKERSAGSQGTVYRVVSERVFVNNKAGAVSCTEGTSSPDYVQLTSTVTSPTMVQPVVLQSVVSPSTGSLDTKNGNLSFRTNNALGEPVGGVSVKVSNRPATTDTEGCANFVSLPEGKYSVAYNGNGLINPKGEGETTEFVSVKGGDTTSVPPSTWDRPATIEPEFIYLEPGTGTARPAPVDSMSVINAANSAEVPIGTPGGPRKALVANSIFPFKAPSEYTVYAGSCTSNNPGTASGNAVGFYSAVVPPAAALKPQIRVPAFELTVTTKSGSEGKTGTEQIVSGATVTLTDLKCKSGGTNVKRTYVTNEGGHLSSEAKGPTEAGVPFGTYKVCASATINKEIRRAEVAEVKVENYAAGTTSKPGGTVLSLNLVKGSSAC